MPEIVPSLSGMNGGEGKEGETGRGSETITGMIGESATREESSRSSDCGRTDVAD